MSTLMLFAAGRGSRMRELTADRPKPLVEVAGKPLIDHALDLAADAGISRAVVNLHYRAEMLKAHLGARSRPTIAFSHEEILLETGGGLKAALPLLPKGQVQTLNADAVWAGPNPFAGLRPAPTGGARLLLVPKERALGHLGAGDFFMAPDGQLARRGDAAQAPFVYTGLQVLDPAPVYAWPETIFSLNPVWDAMLAQGWLMGAVYDGTWCDVGQPESLALAKGLLSDA